MPDLRREVDGRAGYGPAREEAVVASQGGGGQEVAVVRSGADELLHSRAAGKRDGAVVSVGAADGAAAKSSGRC